MSADGRVHEPDREPHAALLHDARHARAGARERRAAPGSARPRSALDDRRAPRARAPAVRPARRARRPCCSTTACTSAACCPRSPRPTRSTSPRTGCAASCTTSSRPSDPDDRARRELETLAAGVKAVATWHATATIQECREACGGAGYLRENRFAALKADSDVFTTFEGDNTVLLQLVAKNLLTDYRDQFGELDPLGTATFVAAPGGEPGGRAERAARAARAARRPARCRAATTSATCSTATPSSSCSAGATSTCSRASRGGSRAASTTARDPFEVLVDCQDHVRHDRPLVGRPRRARGVRRRGRATARTRPRASCSTSSAACTRCRRSSASAAGTRSTGASRSPRSKAVIKAVNALCAELRPHAGTLVDAFGVPESCLGAWGRPQ